MKKKVDYKFFVVKAEKTILKLESIGIHQLETPLLSLGIAENTEDVKKIIASVDKDGSGQIEFGEFLGIIKAKTENSGNNSVLINFFKGSYISNRKIVFNQLINFSDMINGNLAGGSIPNKLPFNMIIDTIRRKKFMDSFLATDIKTREQGEKVRRVKKK